MKKINQYVIRDLNNLENIVNICSMLNVVVYTVQLKDNSIEYVIDEIYGDLLTQLIDNKQIEFVNGLEVFTNDNIEES